MMASHHPEGWSRIFHLPIVKTIICFEFLPGIDGIESFLVDPAGLPDPFGSRERLPLAWTEPGETCEVDHEGADDAAVFEPNASNLDLVFG